MVANFSPSVQVLIFSDPMVEVMSNVGERVSVPPFYISFVLAPLASNASELIASITYALSTTRSLVGFAQLIRSDGLPHQVRSQEDAKDDYCCARCPRGSCLHEQHLLPRDLHVSRLL